MNRTKGILLERAAGNKAEEMQRRYSLSETTLQQGKFRGMVHKYVLEDVSILNPLVDLLIIHLVITLTNRILEIYIPYMARGGRVFIGYFENFLRK